MPPRNLTTYALTTDLAYGAAITDVRVTNKLGQRNPAQLRKKGDSIDLKTIAIPDIPMFCRSAYCGMIQTMLLYGTLVTVQQEVSLELGGHFDAALNEIMRTRGYSSGFGGEKPEIVMVAPGCQVAVSSIPELPIPNVMPNNSIPAQKFQMGEQLEPGLQGPPETIMELRGGMTEPLQGPRPEPESQMIDAGLQAGGRTGYANWKANVAWADAKSMILASLDLNFLEWVSSSDDSKQFQKLAAKRIEDLAAKVTG